MAGVKPALGDRPKAGGSRKHIVCGAGADRLLITPSKPERRISASRWPYMCDYYDFQDTTKGERTRPLVQHHVCGWVGRLHGQHRITPAFWMN